MKSCITLVLLLRFLANNALADEDNTLGFIPINVVNITMPDNGSVLYPDILVLLPHEFSAEQRAEFMEQLALGIVGDIVESPDNALRADTDGGMDAALEEAARQIVSLNTPGANLTLTPHSDKNTTRQIYALVPTVEEEYIRKRRSLERLAPLVRQKRTLKKYSKSSKGSKGCMICQMLQPKQPIVINVYKQNGCGGGCQPQQHYQPPPCGQPQCGYHPQPRPPPVYHPPQQTCDPCNQRPSYHQQQPVYQQPYQQQPSWSYSQSSAQSSSSSGSWGKKK